MQRDRKAPLLSVAKSLVHQLDSVASEVASEATAYPRLHASGGCCQAMANGWQWG